jgi:hypothetical protein
MSIEKIYNIETEETTELPLSQDAILSLQNEQSKIDAEQNQAKARLEAREAVLQKLGLTVDEAKLLLS